MNLIFVEHTAISGHHLSAMSSVPFVSYSAVKVHQTIKEQKERQKSFGYTQPMGTDNSGTKCKTAIAYQLLIARLYDTNLVISILDPDRFHHNYNSKFMNSVWGLYNRYAPQAFQKNEEVAKMEAWGTALSRPH